MAHHTHTTDALVLGGFDAGEGSRVVVVYTRELGLLMAHARSAREARSKLRYSLQPYASSVLSLVRGKEVWRLTGAREERNYYYALSDEPIKREALMRVCALIRRLVRGEAPHAELFALLSEGFDFLEDATLTPSEVFLWECTMVLRILHVLGYADGESSCARVYEGPMDSDVLEAAAHNKALVVRHINAALSATGL